jgi:hypothetical protein
MNLKVNKGSQSPTGGPKTDSDAGQLCRDAHSSLSVERRDSRVREQEQGRDYERVWYFII